MSEAKANDDIKARIKELRDKVSRLLVAWPDIKKEED